ncbi:MAG: CapA family protein [Candidatus Ventricola sp.]
MARKPRRRMSLGSMAMLLLTALVVLGCGCFLSMIVGDGLYARTGDFLRRLAQEGLFDAPAATPTPAPAAAESAFWIEDTPAPTAAPTPTPAPMPTTMTLAVAGTVYAPKVVRESALTGAHYDFAPVFAGLGDTLSDADLAIVTLETTTAGQDKGFGNYNTAPEILDGLRGCGVDLVALATERALDKGYEGLELTIRSLTARGLAYAGANADAQSSDATMMRIGGVQVAVLSYTYGLSEEGSQKTGGDKLAAVALMDTQRMIDDIRQARADGANVVIVLPHWGTKNISETPENVKRLAVQLAEAGADVILGTHPNVPQGTERLTVQRADGLTHEAVVCYSLGCLLTDSRTAENTAGMVAHVSITYDPATRRTTMGEMYCTPVYIARQRVSDETVYRVVDAESAAALAALTESEQQAAREAVEIIRKATQADEQEGQG